MIRDCNQKSVPFKKSASRDKRTDVTLARPQLRKFSAEVLRVPGLGRYEQLRRTETSETAARKTAMRQDN